MPVQEFPSRSTRLPVDEEQGKLEPPRVSPSMGQSNYNIFTLEYYQRENNTIVDALCCFLTWICCASVCYPCSCFCNIFSILLAKSDTSGNHFTRIVLIYFNVVALFALCSYYIGLLFVLYFLANGSSDKEDDNEHLIRLFETYKELSNPGTVSSTVAKSLSPF
eukprot:CAMPEP_0201481028 /NCGR_PEP_ID=MMETSP0151_2-20130828/5366_1 /ASSEMBLY_ACC=CAM_ASM_000257 /TAXON_ID=200890 /ORGANISM="Paramoeba atlantica, Strain 621/1 / CCAP 1560/9" /LENGTH=163 /DNA_ID=CAMNT_0047863049 /DNA_START=16 /DNA_END=507 /DNA_ORIENTATION=-